MDKKNWGKILLGAGVVLLLLSLTADIIGIGGGAGFGIRQIIGSIAGIIAIAVGYFLAFK
jgi:hypothetical protein